MTACKGLALHMANLDTCGICRTPLGLSWKQRQKQRQMELKMGTGRCWTVLYQGQTYWGVLLHQGNSDKGDGSNFCRPWDLQVALTQEWWMDTVY